MIRRRKKLAVPTLDTTSTADISFMLLIFFLVTTSMDTDKGISRLLPPAQTEQQQRVTDVQKDVLLQLELTDKDVLLADGEAISLNEVEQRVTTLVQKAGKEHVISIKADRNSTYDAYFRLQNAIVSAYRQLRDAYATKYFGKNFDQISNEEQREIVRRAIPQRIAETYQKEGES